MIQGLRFRRLNNEWLSIEQLACENGGVLALQERTTRGPHEIFSLVITQTEGLRAARNGFQLVSAHAFELRFPRFYPSVPIEAYLSQPLFHPNIDPLTGFVCLWERTSPGDTAIEAVRRVQALIVWKMVNLEAAHVMQPEAASWFSTGADVALPLRHVLLHEPIEWRLQRSARAFPAKPRRMRLSPL